MDDDPPSERVYEQLFGQQPDPSSLPPSGLGYGGAQDALLGAVAAVTLIPFLQAFATKTGEDMYAWIRERGWRRDRRKLKRQRQQGMIYLADPERRVLISFPSDLSPGLVATAAWEIEPVGPGEAPRAEWVGIAWDPAANDWTKIPFVSPPREAIRLRTKER